jgi:hypothetical protein
MNSLYGYRLGAQSAHINTHDQIVPTLAIFDGASRGRHLHRRIPLALALRILCLAPVARERFRSRPNIIASGFVERRAWPDASFFRPPRFK